MKKNKYIVVVAHPDDEILWASSICEKASKVIICFSEDKNSLKISQGRKIFSKNAPENFYFLDIKEPSQKGITFFQNKSYIRNCISDKSFKKIKKELLKLIDCKSVYTHNYWGEYGHPQHVAIHLAVRSICKEKKISCKMFSYFNLRTFALRNCYLRRNYVILEKKKVSEKLFFNLKNQYTKSHCWTFPRSYAPPKYEYFYEINQGKRANFLPKKQIPGIYIFWGQLHYKFNFKNVSVKDYKLLFLILFIDLTFMPLYCFKYVFNKFLKLKTRLFQG